MTRLILSLLLVSPALASGQSQEKPPEKATVEAPQQPQPAPSGLAKLARQTRQQRDEVASGQTVTVYTNATLKQPDRGRVGQSVAPPPPPAEEGAEMGGAAEGEAAQAKTPEEEIEAIAQELTAKRAEYVAAVNEFQVLQLSMNDMRDRYLQEADVSAQEKFEADLVMTMERLRSSEQRIASLKAEITELQAKARAAGMEGARLRRLVGRLPEPSRIVQYPPDEADSEDIYGSTRRRGRPPQE